MAWSNHTSVFHISYIAGSLFLICTLVVATVLMLMNFRQDSSTPTVVFPQVQISQSNACDGINFCKVITSEPLCNETFGCVFDTLSNSCQMILAKDLCTISLMSSSEFCKPWHVATPCKMQNEETCHLHDDCKLVDSACVSRYDACTSVLQPAKECVELQGANVKVDKCFALNETDCTNDDDCRFESNVCMRKSCCRITGCRSYTDAVTESKRQEISPLFQNEDDFTDNIFNTASMLFADCENCNSAYSFVVWVFWISLFLFVMCAALCICAV